MSSIDDEQIMGVLADDLYAGIDAEQHLILSPCSGISGRNKVDECGVVIDTGNHAIPKFDFPFHNLSPAFGINDALQLRLKQPSLRGTEQRVHASSECAVAFGDYEYLLHDSSEEGSERLLRSSHEKYPGRNF